MLTFLFFIFLRNYIPKVEKITSTQNPKIKNLARLHKSSERREQKLFLTEGLKEICFAQNEGFKLHSIFWCPEMGLPMKKLDLLLAQKVPFYEISGEIFSKVAYREGSDGVLAVIHEQKLPLDKIRVRKNSLVIVIESVEKPGNLGAILRTADAAGVDAVLICNSKTDVFNPNIIRSSLGCVFSNQVVCCSNEDAIEWLRGKKIKTYAALLSNESKPYHEINYTAAVALVLGTEDEGLSEFWIKNSDGKIIIPMLGRIDSLNVSVSAAILVFEALRQRNFTK